MKLLLWTSTLAASLCATGLTGNWMAATLNGDGTTRKVWLNLKEDGGKITGTIRATQFVYNISDSTGGPDRYTLTATIAELRTK